MEQPHAWLQTGRPIKHEGSSVGHPATHCFWTIRFHHYRHVMLLRINVISATSFCFRLNHHRPKTHQPFQSFRILRPRVIQNGRSWRRSMLNGEAILTDVYHSVASMEGAVMVYALRTPRERLSKRGWTAKPLQWSLCPRATIPLSLVKQNESKS